MRDAPEMSEELFERFLPYAAGLGVEKPWSEAWAAQLARIAPERQREYQPQWYHGSSWSPGNIGAAAASSVAAVSAAMPPATFMTSRPVTVARKGSGSTARQAATSAEAEPPPTLDVDRPFLYAIRDRQSQAVLFIGRVLDPREG